MIDWKATLELSGVANFETAKYRKTKLVIRCDKCSSVWQVIYRVETKTRPDPDLCKLCQGQDPNRVAKIRATSVALWQNPEYREKNLAAVRTEEHRQLLAKNSTGKKQSDSQRHLASLNAQRQWEDPEFRIARIRSSKALWKDADYLAKVSQYNHQRSPERMAQLRRNQCHVSNLQTILYSVLNDLGVAYHREHEDKPDDPECTIGPYGFDCVIPRTGKPTLLIECQGEYWHRHKENRDAAKALYISQYHTGYELKCLWENEFKERNKIKSIIKEWLDLDEPPKIDFTFDQLTISDNPNRDQCKLLLSKYHYLHNIGRGGIVYGAYLGAELIAVCVFSPPIRQNRDAKTDRELSRFCIHPSYQHKNLASWFISRCLKLLNPVYTTVWSFSDQYVGHSGTIYKASNFKLDGVVAKDYWYVSKDGWVMHKKTLYNHAVKMHTTEAAYALANDYTKVWGSEKLRYRYDR